MGPKDAKEMANSLDPEQTANPGADQTAHSGVAV